MRFGDCIGKATIISQRMIHYTMQVEELMRSHPNLGEFIAKTKAEALELTKDLEQHIKAGYFEIVKAADQLLQLSLSVKSARQLLIPLPDLPQPPRPHPLSAARPEDLLWTYIDSNSLGKACKECVNLLTATPSEEAQDVFEYLQSLCCPSLLNDSEDLVASKLAGWGVLREYEKGSGELGEELLGKFAQQLLIEIAAFIGNLTCGDIARANQLLIKAQNHYEVCFLKGAIQQEISALGLVSTCTAPTTASEQLKAALDTILPTFQAKLTAVIREITEPQQTLELRFVSETRYGILGMRELTQDLWVQQLQKCALQRLNEFKFAQNIETESPKGLLAAYEAENGALLGSLAAVSHLEEVKPALTSILDTHLTALTQVLEQAATQSPTSSLVLTVAYFLYLLQHDSPTLRELLRTLATAPRYESMLGLWASQVRTMETLAVLKEVRRICGDDVSFCSAVLPIACPQALDSHKSSIATAFGLSVSEEISAETAQPLPALPQLPSLQLLPRFLPHLIYS